MDNATFGPKAACVLLDAGIDVLDCDGDSCLVVRDSIEAWSDYPANDVYAPFRLAVPDTEIPDAVADAVCRAQEGLCVRDSRGARDVFAVVDGQWRTKWGGKGAWRVAIRPPGVAWWAPNAPRTFRIVPAPSAVTLEETKASPRRAADGIETLPRTTRVTSEAVVHAEAGGVVQWSGDHLRVRGGHWEYSDGASRWVRNDGKWPFVTGAEYTLHPTDYLDDTPPDVEPKSGAEFRRWLVETGRTGVYAGSGHRIRWNRAEWHFERESSTGAWCVSAGPGQHHEGRPESGTWEREK